jgi:hypothetical protein
MSKPWQPYAHHILDAIDKVWRIQARGDIAVAAPTSLPPASPG